MLLFVRVAAYVLSGVAICQTLSGSGGLAGIFASDRILALDPENGMVLGVCAGIYKYSGIDASFIRFVWVILSFYRGIGVVLYLLAFLLMPLPG